jgi:lysophospholipase L1-like esterase
LKAFKHAVIYAGGNDSSQNTDIELFEERYCQLIESIHNQNPSCEISLCTVCPRKDTDVTDYNKIITDIAKLYNLQCINVYDAFTDSSGSHIRRYFGRDGIHLSTTGTKRLLGTVNKCVPVVNDFDNIVFQRYRKPNYRSHYQGQNWNRCRNCGMNNHKTTECRRNRTW